MDFDFRTFIEKFQQTQNFVQWASCILWTFIYKQDQFVSFIVFFFQSTGAFF